MSEVLVFIYCTRSEINYTSAILSLPMRSPNQDPLDLSKVSNAE